MVEWRRRLRGCMIGCYARSDEYARYAGRKESPEM